MSIVQPYCLNEKESKPTIHSIDTIMTFLDTSFIISIAFSINILDNKIRPQITEERILEFNRRMNVSQLLLSLLLQN